ncbi:hypothetical protein [Tunicatimonas pelagia]|uniref:hypothetical protein n=1 Tax=Tunicatimonas pelagia TaxID=931531 RepID=UPI002664F61F|nr:hypothetical protein [Tunicatimonas pelagia]WKN44419.1 hypothetical protein P0M28_05505 [Tunicatimonas pelagia]
MRYIYVICIFLLSSCGVKEIESVSQNTPGEIEKPVEDDSIVSQAQAQEVESVPETNETEPMIFDLGSESLFTDTCAFYLSV